MPIVSVPLTRNPSTPSPPLIEIHYSTLGTGHIPVLLLPGMCVPSSMYDSMSHILSLTSQFTCIAPDNRGIGASAAPPATLLGGPGYTARDLALDAWAVVDHARAHLSHLRGDDVAVVGHSMGGMIAQQMVALRPRRVRFVALLATHGGGVWNTLPTMRLVSSAMRVAWSGFDRDVHAAVNLSLHFTQRFLDAWVAPDLDFCMPGRNERKGAKKQTEKLDRMAGEDIGIVEKASKESENDRHVDDERSMPSEPENEEEQDGEPLCTGRSPNTSINDPAEPPGSSLSSFEDPIGDSRRKVDGNDSYGDEQSIGSGSATEKVTNVGLGYLESKAVELFHDAHFFFGLTHSFADSIWRRHRLVVEAVAKRRQRSRRRRRDIYHAMYTGAEVAKVDSSSKHTRESESEVSASMTGNPEDSQFVMYGHAAVVRSHSLPRWVARGMRECARLGKLVMIGRHDYVVTPSSSRALASSIGANTVVEVEAAHFITDEAAAEVTTHIIYGLRKAFFARNPEPCACDWCVLDEGEEETVAPSCRMC